MITWPDIYFPPINLYALPPAWFFYMTAKEKWDYFKQKALLVEEV
jgi:hypothetical protein